MIFPDIENFPAQGHAVVAKDVVAREIAGEFSEKNEDIVSYELFYCFRKRVVRILISKNMIKSSPLEIMKSLKTSKKNYVEVKKNLEVLKVLRKIKTDYVLFRKLPTPRR